MGVEAKAEPIWAKAEPICARCGKKWQNTEIFFSHFVTHTCPDGQQAEIGPYDKQE